MQNLKELIDTCIDDPQYAESRRQVKAETWMHSGEGAKRTADYLVNKYNELTTVEKDK